VEVDDASPLLSMLAPPQGFLLRVLNRGPAMRRLAFSPPASRGARCTKERATTSLWWPSCWYLCPSG